MKKYLIYIICLIIIYFSLPLSSYALYLFESDYDKDIWYIEKLSCELVDTIPQNWYPLKFISEYLPIDVSWDEANKEIIIFCHNLPKAICEKRYKADNLPANLIIKNGITYCSPIILVSFLGNKSFLYNNELYYFAGESVESQLIKANSNNTKSFKDVILTVLYEIKLKLPDEYDFIRSHLTGKIICISRDEVPSHLSMASAYIYYARKPPVCYIVERKVDNYILARSIAHEAFHVWQYHNDEINEEDAHAYGKEIQSRLAEIQ